MGTLILIYIPCGSEEEAEKIATALLQKKLIACGNILPSKSLFFWKGETQHQLEYILLGKTHTQHFEAIKREVHSLHSYDLPAILKIPFDANKDFQEWITKTVTPSV